MSGAVERVGEMLARRGLRIATAESCTGGMVAARLTDRPGASRFFELGLITYSDAAKQELLGVRAATLAAYGAVSESVAGEMLDGALRHADAALAVTGVAGPGGGSPEKPVGTVWIAAGVVQRREARRFHFEGDRARIREASVTAALELIEWLLKEAP